MADIYMKHGLKIKILVKVTTYQGLRAKIKSSVTIDPCFENQRAKAST